MNGILVIDKPTGITSRDVVNEVGKILGTKKVGHTGTLDPLATGVLVLCVGEATRLVDLIVASEKEYVAEVVLGLHTDTLDITGEVLEKQDVLVSQDEVIDVLNSMKGSYLQEVPIYSAVKVNGKKLYEYARSGKEVALPKREVTIFDISLVDDLHIIDGMIHFSFRCTVSKGTYIRSLIRDIADHLGTVGVMAGLRRVRQGDYSLDQAFCLEDIYLQTFSMLPMKSAFSHYEIIEVDDYLKAKILNGRILDHRYDNDVVVFVDQLGNVLALYQKYGKDESKMKPWKVFSKLF